MPRQPEWIHRLPEILEQLQALPSGTVDRFLMEKLFAVSSRQATRILRRLGAHSMGGALLISTHELQTNLRALIADDTVIFEQHRRDRLLQHLERAREEIRSRRIQIPPPQSSTSLPHLPPEIQLEPGLLTIRFTSSIELLQQLMFLARTASEDWEAFERKAEAPKLGSV